MRFLRQRNAPASDIVFRTPSTVILAVLFVREWYELSELAPGVPTLDLNLGPNRRRENRPELGDYCQRLWSRELQEPHSAVRTFPDAITSALPDHELEGWLTATLPPLARALATKWREVPAATSSIVAQFPTVRWVVVIPTGTDFVLGNPGRTGLLISANVLNA